ncbi:hypothetical protein FQA39_LY05837 [Lamprigera yunnana]|nr:hypothetical protein FQA39_LY05837 [Lamprigera yunnana]
MALYTLIIYLISAALFDGVLANICDVCVCQPYRERVFSITCNGSYQKDLHLTSSIMMKVESANMVTIKNFQTVSIERNSFAQLDQLDTLVVENCVNLYMATGAFSTLNSLLINNIQDVAFGEMAFMGARGIKNIIINSSNITELPRFALYDVRGLNRLNLYNVNIENITSNSFKIDVSNLEIENSTIKNVQKEGIIVNATKILIQTSKFETSADAAVQLLTKYQTRFLNNNFEGNFQWEVISPFAEFSGNTFENVNTKAFNSITLTRAMNNTILDTNYNRIFQLFDHRDFHHNKFVCQCNQHLLNVKRNSVNYEILKNNFCNTNCSLSIFDFEIHSAASCMKENVIDASTLCVITDAASELPPNNLLGTTESNNDLPVILQPRYLIDDGEHDRILQSGSSRAQISLFISIVLFLLLQINHYCY